MLVIQEKRPTNVIMKSLREDSGYSLRVLAKELKTDHSYISAVERGKLSPSMQMLEKYHKYFHVSYEYLLGETDEPTSTELGKTKFDTDEAYALKRLAEENRQCYNTLSYLLTDIYGQVFLEELSICIHNNSLDTISNIYRQLCNLKQKKRNYTQDEIRTFLQNQNQKEDS